MEPVKFPQCNARYGPPEGYAESQIRTIHAFHGKAANSLDGDKIVIVAHKPSAEDIARINAGEPIFLTMVGGLMPHCLTTKFEEAINTA